MPSPQKHSVRLGPANSYSGILFSRIGMGHLKEQNREGGEAKQEHVITRQLTPWPDVSGSLWVPSGEPCRTHLRIIPCTSEEEGFTHQLPHPTGVDSCTLSGVHVSEWMRHCVCALATPRSRSEASGLLRGGALRLYT